MMNRIADVKWGYLMGTSDVFDEFKVRFGKRLGTDETITIVKALSLAKGQNGRLYLYEDCEQIGSTSAIINEYWVEDFCLGNEQVALAKCFETKSGSKYYFTPIQML